MLNTYLSKDRILLGASPDNPLITIPYDTLVPQTQAGYTDDDRWMLRSVTQQYFKGRVVKAPSGEPGQTHDVVLGYPLGTNWSAIEHYSAKLSSVGNPDHHQYCAVSPSALAFGLTLEDAINACIRYRDAYELGGGNWSDNSGRIYLHVPTSKPKLVGRVWYNGRYLTNAEIREDNKRWRAALKAC